jgi:hypothetical protein
MTTELSPGLHRWTTRHPEWRAGAEPDSPSDWPRTVGSVLADTPQATVFIDALIDQRDEAAWEPFDRHVAERALPVIALTTIGFHRRSRDALVARYGATTSRARKNLPAGVVPFPVRGAGEVMFFLERHRALVPGDRLIGSPASGLRLCPQSWLGYLSSPPSRSELAGLLRPLLEWPIERVLVSHGDPVLSGGRDAIAAALDAATGRGRR